LSIRWRCPHLFNHLEQVDERLSREPYALPRLVMKREVKVSMNSAMILKSKLSGTSEHFRAVAI
jgi:hypothetical protein